MVRQCGLGKDLEIGTVLLLLLVPPCAEPWRGNSCKGEPASRLGAGSGCRVDAKKAWRWPELCFFTKGQAQLVLRGALGGYT